MDIDEWCASVFGALSPVAITLPPLHRFGIKVPYVDSPQLNAIRHAQVPGKIYLYIRRYRPKRTICFFAYIAGTAAVVGLSRELLLAGTIAGNTWTIT